MMPGSGRSKGDVVMKKIVVFMLVLGMASMAAQAVIIDVRTVGLGSDGHKGTSTDPLIPSEIIEIEIFVVVNPYTYQGKAYPTYDGYAIIGMDLDLHVSGPGSLEVGQIDLKGTLFDDLQHHDGFGVWSESSPLIVDNQIAKLKGGALPGSEPRAGEVLVYNLFIHCEGIGNVLVELTLGAEGGKYKDFTPGPLVDPPVIDLLEGDLGELVIHQIPEPMTLGLLALGGLGLLRRRRA